MRHEVQQAVFGVVFPFAFLLTLGCSSAGGPGQQASGGKGAGASGGSLASGSQNGEGAGFSSGGATTSGGAPGGGMGNLGGTETGGTPGGGGPGSGGSGGTDAGGSSSGGGNVGTGGGVSGGASGDGPCGGAPWPEADPSTAGPFAVVTETEIGPLAGEGEDGEPVPFTLFRPETLGEEGRCHPVITWGNGTSSTPSLYGVMLRHLASHGFLVIGSDSPNVARGTPPPMVVGAEWLVEENENPSSPFYHMVDVEHVGATGHSQGGMATSAAGNDPVVKTIAPLCGAGRATSLSGPAFFMCGGMDDVVSCDGIENTFNSVTNVPAMFAKFLTGDHANWLSFGGSVNVKPVEAAVTAWMRVHLMNDTNLRPWFYGASCGLCEDPDWEIARSGMD